MRKTLSLFALFMLAFICPAAAQQIVIDEITIQGAESYTVNQEMVVRFKVNNNTGAPLAAEDYSLSVNVGGVYAGKPEGTKAIPNGSYESFVAKVAPHKAGENLPVEIVLKGMGTTTAAAEQTVTVNPEVPSGEVQVGTCAASGDLDYYVPLNTYYNYSQSELIYTAEDLGLVAGTKLTGLSFKGYRSDAHKYPVTVWIEQTEDTAPASNNTTPCSTENMIRVYNDQYEFPMAGSSYDHQTIFSIEFPEPITYEGKSLRLFIQTEKGATYSQTYIEVDKSRTGKTANRRNDSSLEAMLASGFKKDEALPVLYLGIEKEPTVVSGQVYIITKNQEVAYPENATVTLANGNVMYMAQTDADGNYSMPVCQDKLTYDVTVEPADYTIFPYKETLALNGTSATKNIGLTEAAGAYILSAEFPETGVENTPVTVKANIANYEDKDMDETNAKVILKLDGEKVAEAEDLLIDAFDNDNVTLTFNPHVSGTKELTVEVYVNDVLQHSKSGNITISKEMATGDFTIKGSEVTANETTSPIRLYSTHSYSQTLLTSDMLNGLAAGSKITGLKLESAQSSNTKNFNFDVKVWVMNTEDGADNITTDPHSADFKQVYSATLVQRYHGKYNDGSVTYEKFFDLVFDEPFIYEGNNIRIAMRADIQGSGYQQTYFKAIKDVRTSWSKSSDNPSIDGVAVDIMDYTWANNASQTPVFTLVVDNAIIVTGTVVNKATNNPIANAELKLTANNADIVYTAKSDAEGKFNLSVIQANHDFTVSVSAEGYKTIQETVPASLLTSALELGIIPLELDVEGAVVSIKPNIGYATFYDSEHAVKIPAGVEAYIFSQLMDMAMPGLVEYSEFVDECGEKYEGVVPAGEPIVLKGSGDVVLEYAEAPEFDNYAEMGANLLAGTDIETTTPAPVWAEDIYEADEFYYYALTLNKQSDPESVGFYWMNKTGSTFTNKAHKAYLALPIEMFATDAKQVFLFNDDAATAIKNVNTSANSAVNGTFNLAGQRVNGNAKGIVIKNGKKFIVK